MEVINNKAALVDCSYLGRSFGSHIEDKQANYLKIRLTGFLLMGKEMLVFLYLRSGERSCGRIST
jgi:hypothetical protein